MSRTAFTIRAWSVYVFVVGGSLAIIPNTVLSVLGLDETEEVWIRVVGVIVVLLSLYYWDAARNEARHHFVATVLGRLFVAAAFIVLWLTGEPWQLLIFAAGDTAGALWTLMALRDEGA